MSDRYAELSRLVQGLFAPASSAASCVGVEVELFPIRFLQKDVQPVTIAELQGILATTGMVKSKGRVSFEPGGQLELSPPPMPGVNALMRQMAELLDDLQCCAATHGVTCK